ncbi:mitosis protein DIM1-domain-containing protein [Lipomyces starkeyi]
MGSVFLPHLKTGWHVDQAIMTEEERLVVIRFGRDWDEQCMRMDELLYRVADRVKNFAVIYVCDIDEVPDFNKMYELYDPCTVMFFFRNKHMMCDFGTGNNNKLNWVLEDKQELIDIIETIYKGAKKGRGLVISPKEAEYIVVGPRGSSIHEDIEKSYESGVSLLQFGLHLAVALRFESEPNENLKFVQELDQASDHRLFCERNKLQVFHTTTESLEFSGIKYLAKMVSLAHASSNGKTIALYLRMLFGIFATVIGITNLLMDSGILGSKRFSSNLHHRTRSHFTTATVASAYFGLVSAANTRDPSEPGYGPPLIFLVENTTISIALTGGHPDLGIGQSLDSFSELSLVSPEEYQDRKLSFHQYGGLIIPYSPTLMSFKNSSVRILNADSPASGEIVIATPETELSQVFELTSAAVLLMPEKYRCMILNSEPFSTWDTVMLAWRMRNSRQRLAEYLYEIEHILNLPHDDSRQSRMLDGLLLLANNDIELRLDESTLDLKRAVIASRKIRTVCV